MGLARLLLAPGIVMFLSPAGTKSVTLEDLSNALSTMMEEMSEMKRKIGVLENQRVIN